MRKLLIVEDEISSREGIKNLLLSSALSLQVETAADGYEGYEKALYFMPDIIISDIKMPKWTGITMAEHLRKKSVSSKLIFLTGFGEFEYAQKAIQLGTSDYILKPVMSKDLIEKVSMLIQELDQKPESQNPLLKSNSKMYLLSEDDLPVFEEQLLPLGYTDYFIGIVYLEEETHLPPEIKELLTRTENAHIVFLPDKHYRGILLGFHKHLIHHSMISRLSVLMQKYKHLTCIYTIKKATQDISWVQEFHLLIKSLCWSIVYNSSFFAFDEEMLRDETNTLDLRFYTKELQRLYYSRDYSACLEFIQDNIYQMQQKQCHPKQILSTVTSSILNVFSEKEYLQALNKITQATTMHEIMACLHWYFEIGLTKKANSGYSHLVQSAIYFIQENYSEPISLSSAAEKLSITPQYLSKLFMHETSQTFVDFLTQVRMEKAKSMLANTSLQINLVSRQVGYTDPKYFCTIFKKYTGLTPNQYRKSSC